VSSFVVFFISLSLSHLILRVILCAQPFLYSTSQKACYTLTSSKGCSRCRCTISAQCESGISVFFSLLVKVVVVVCEMSNFTSLVKINLDTVEVGKLLLCRMKIKQNKSIRKLFNTFTISETSLTLN